MSLRPLLYDLRCRQGAICQACLTACRPKASPAWATTIRSVSTRPKARRRTAIGAKPPQSRTQEREALKALEQFDLLSESAGPTDAPLSVRHFEQDQDGRLSELGGRNATDSVGGAFDMSELTEGLKGLRDGIKSQEEKTLFQDVIRQIGRNPDSIKSKDDIEQVINRLDEYLTSINAQISKETCDLPDEGLKALQRDISDSMADVAIEQNQTAPPRIPEESWSYNQQKKVAKLNTAMKRVWRDVQRGDAINKQHVSAIHKAYHASRLALARSWSQVPVDVWDFLWKILSADESVNIHRLSHISMLARDMSEAKVPLDPGQQVVAIEAVFVDGWESRAIENWKRCVSSLGHVASETFEDYWGLGVRMYCRVGDVAQAERAANKILDQGRDARILFPLIRVHCEKATSGGAETAWNIYRRMREKLGQTMTLQDYDQVISCFLTANQTENALYAFVDMMSDGQIDLKRQRHMPSVVANKFFLGKWLKRLIGAGDLDGAFNVVNFMRQKGVSASPIQLNGLIGAWHRAGGTKDLELADALAWDMIASRIEFVQARASGQATKDVAKNPATAMMPRATLETFCLLADNYRLRNLHGRLMTLWDAFHDAEISPDAFMMNQLLESHIQSGHSGAAVELYHSLVSERGILPDPYTFSALWKTLRINRLTQVDPEAVHRERSATRDLFAETVKFRGVFPSNTMDGQLARKILHTFRRLEDNAGFAVALTTLKSVFNFLPSEILVLEMILDTSKLAWDSPQQRRRLMLAKREMERDLLASVAGDERQLEGQKRQVALYEYLQKRVKPALGQEGSESSALVDAATEMGVYDILTPKTARER